MQVSVSSRSSPQPFSAARGRASFSAVVRHRVSDEKQAIWALETFRLGRSLGRSLMDACTSNSLGC